MDFLYLLAGIRTPILDAIMSVVTYLGNELFVIGVMCIFVWCVDKNIGYRLGLVFFLSGLGLQLMKIIFRVPRPWVIDPDFKPVESALPTASGYSFPSGHTQGSTALFLPLAIWNGKGKKRVLCTVCAILLVAIVAFSRMYLGVHTPNDIIVGSLISVAALVIVTPVSRILERTERYDIIVSAILTVISLVVIVAAVILYGNGTVTEYKMAADCCKSAVSGLAFAIGWHVERRYIRFDVTCDRFWKQIVKCLIGVVGALIIKESFKWIFGVNLAVDMIRYFLVVLWVIAAFPFLWSRLPISKKEKKTETTS